ncbi:hypothetical protein K9L05_01810 [Candidatus Babeliales bacterium]|nr:hypothetical protein [Candidatus Babeliales bacterium]MCF7899363.1 hypothetical protein [Candidatus Babeliales bacterium]
MENTAKKIANLIGNLELLLKESEEQKNLETKFFDSILTLVNTKIKEYETKNRKEDVSSLKEIQEKLNEEKTAVLDFFNEDISFLQENIKAISEIQKIQDKEKIEEFLGMVVDSDIDLSDNQNFKKDLDERSQDAKKELDAIKDQIEQALEKDDVKELKLMVEAFIEQDEEEDLEGEGDEQDDELDYDFEEDEDDDCCSSCNKCSKDGCCDDGIDIFEQLDKNNQK